MRVVDGRGDRHADPHDRAADHREQQQRAAAQLVDEERAADGDQELLARVEEVDVGLADLRVVAGGGEEGGHVVGEDGCGAGR